VSSRDRNHVDVSAEEPYNSMPEMDGPMVA